MFLQKRDLHFAHKINLLLTVQNGKMLNFIMNQLSICYKWVHLYVIKNWRKVGGDKKFFKTFTFIL